ncbi:hypothetical protein [Clostridium algidicarnis]|nr:hypothetical protein [Clostridium algidicarnis]
MKYKIWVEEIVRRYFRAAPGELNNIINQVKNSKESFEEEI